MKTLKTQKGITLVALVITIIVLLILAIVAIGAVQDSGIIGHAQNSAKQYNARKADEDSMLGNYETTISGYENGGGFKPEGDGPGEPIPGEEEIMWVYYIEDEDDNEDCLAFIGDVQKLSLDENIAVKAYMGVLVYNDETEEEEVKYDNTSEIISKELNDVTYITIDKSVENLTLGTVAADRISSTDKDDVAIKNLTILKTFGDIVEGVSSLCENIENVIFSEGITSIEAYEFGKNTFLKTITLPLSLTTIKHHAFSQCTNLSVINYNGTMEDWSNVDFDGSSVFDRISADAKVICSDGEIIL